MYRTYDYKTQVLAASIRNTKHIIECVEVGADVATCPLSAIKGLLNHPLFGYRILLHFCQVEM